jgi:hypothetical protein
MLQKEEITAYLNELDQALGSAGIKGEICLYGGAVMCLAYEARPSTKDVDAIFKPSDAIRTIAQQIATKHGLREDWLNDAVKGFVVTHPSKVYVEMPNLTVYVPEPDYLLAMKAMAARVEGMDKEDVIFLIKKLGIKSPSEVFAIIEKYYPRQRIRPATQFFIEELFGQ